MPTCSISLSTLPAHQWVPALCFSLASLVIVLAVWLYQHTASTRSSQALAAYQVSVAYIQQGTLFDEVDVARNVISTTAWQGRLVDCPAPLTPEHGYESDYPHNHALFFALTALADPQAASSVTATTPAVQHFRFLNRARRQLSMFWRSVVSLYDARELPRSFFANSLQPWVVRGNDYRGVLEPLDLAHYVVDHLQQGSPPADPDELYHGWCEARRADGPYLPHGRLERLFPKGGDGAPKFKSDEQRDLVWRLMAVRRFQLEHMVGEERLCPPLLE